MEILLESCSSRIQILATVSSLIQQIRPEIIGQWFLGKVGGMSVNYAGTQCSLIFWVLKLNLDWLAKPNFSLISKKKEGKAKMNLF